MSERRDKLSITTALVILLLTAAIQLVFALLVEGALHMAWGDRSLPTTDEVMEVSLVPEEDERDPEAERTKRDELDTIVQNDAVVDERPPEQTDKISEFDNTTPKETTAPLSRRRSGREPTTPSQGQQSSDPSTTERPSTVDGRSDQSADKATEGIDEALDALREDESGELAPGASGAPKANTPGLSGMRESMRETFGQRGSMDKFEDIDEGDVTILNSRRNRFASFFNRVRDAIAQHWHPEVIHAARDPYGKVYGNKTRVTRLHIVLAADGSVRRIGIDSPAGIGYLDEEAIRAVRAAQPFTNPPAQLVDPKTGMIEFSFSFILLLDGSKRIFRYNR